MNGKTRTYPASVCTDPNIHTLWNVRQLDGTLVFQKGPVTKYDAEQACAAINEAYDQGRDAE